MDYIYPMPLTKGDTIGLITPSSPLMQGRLEAGIQYFEKQGFKAKLGHHNTKCDRFLAGSINEWAKRLTVPVIKNFPYGHGSNHQYVLPVGGKVRLDANAHSLAIIF